MSTIDRFVSDLKARLRRDGHYRWTYMEGPGTEGDIGTVEVDWSALDKEIDAFAAEFKRPKRGPDEQ